MVRNLFTSNRQLSLQNNSKKGHIVGADICSTWRTPEDQHRITFRQKLFSIAIYFGSNLQYVLYFTFASSKRIPYEMIKEAPTLHGPQLNKYVSRYESCTKS